MTPERETLVDSSVRVTLTVCRGGEADGSGVVNANHRAIAATASSAIPITTTHVRRDQRRGRFVDMGPYFLTRSAPTNLAAAPNERGGSIPDMALDRTSTLAGRLAARGFGDPHHAAEVVRHWLSRHEEATVVGLIEQALGSADPLTDDWFGTDAHREAFAELARTVGPARAAWLAEHVRTTSKRHSPV